MDWFLYDRHLHHERVNQYECITSCLALLYFYIAVIEKEVEIVGTKKIEAKDKHRVNQNFNNAIHKEIIQNKWLSDELINLSQTILFKNFPLISGFEDTALGPLNMFSVQTGEFAQVFHENNQRVTVSSPTEKATSVVYSTIHYRKKA